MFECGLVCATFWWCCDWLENLFRWPNFEMFVAPALVPDLVARCKFQKTTMCENQMQSYQLWWDSATQKFSSLICFSQPNLFCWDSQICDELDFVICVRKIQYCRRGHFGSDLVVQYWGEKSICSSPNSHFPCYILVGEPSMAANLESSETGFPLVPTWAGAHPFVLDGVGRSSGSLPGSPETPHPNQEDTLPTPARGGLRKRMRLGRRSEQTCVISGKHMVTLRSKTPMSKRPRPEWDPAWAVRTGGENDFTQDLHTEGKKFNFCKNSKNTKDSKDHLEDWDTMLMGSSLPFGADPRVLYLLLFGS